MQKYIITILVVIVRTGIVLGSFTKVDFQKNFTDTDDVVAQKLYTIQHDIVDRYGSLFSVQEDQKE